MMKLASAGESPQDRIQGKARRAKASLGGITATGNKQMNAVVRSPVDQDRKRLDTWKEIAVYLCREVRTAQRWAKGEGLPVHKHFHAKGNTVYAFKHEVDAWLQKRQPLASQPVSSKQYSKHGRYKLNPKPLTATPMPARPQSSPQNAAAGVGSLDLLQGENRIRVYFYIQLQAKAM